MFNFLKRSKSDATAIDKNWPSDELESVSSCPYCHSTQRSLAYKDVQDWSFYCAPGKWNYWDCTSCEALYLDPRPAERSIGKAYSNYYTHDNGEQSFKQQLRIRLKNECFSHWLKTNITPRLHIPIIFFTPFNFLKKYIAIPFELPSLVNLPKGSLLDFGCGNGGKLKLAHQLGWSVKGIEIDPAAVASAQSQGLDVIHGDYRMLADYQNTFDCIVCSHVLEHVHEPLVLLQLLSKALKPNGTLLLSLPNSKSNIRRIFGSSWRGLEAPRHISLPSTEFLLQYFRNKKTTVFTHNGYKQTTAMASMAIHNARDLNVNASTLQAQLGLAKLAVANCFA